MEDTKQKPETLRLGWLNPVTNEVRNAGVAFYIEKFGEYILKIDEEPREKQYFLKPIKAENKSINYRMELVIKKI